VLSQRFVDTEFVCGARKGREGKGREGKGHMCCIVLCLQEWRKRRQRKIIRADQEQLVSIGPITMKLLRPFEPTHVRLCADLLGNLDTMGPAKNKIKMEINNSERKKERKKECVREKESAKQCETESRREK
jgi:hypothetical protein